jgi:hypothetical protein
LGLLQAVKGGEEKSEGFAAAGLRYNNHVAAAEGDGPRLWKESKAGEVGTMGSVRGEGGEGGEVKGCANVPCL